MIVLVCGSRDWTDREAVNAALDRYHQPWLKIIHGNAPGADSLAAEWAFRRAIPCTPFPADWATHGKAAGPRRNVQMLDEGPALVIAFQRNGSRGTAHTIREARRRGIPVEVHSC